MSNNKKFVVEANFIENAMRLNLSLSEFLLLLYFENDDEGIFDLEKISQKLKVDSNILLEAFNNLFSKKLITLESEKDITGKRIDKVSLNNFYEKLKENKQKEEKNKLKEDIFSKFESEFGRPLSGVEFEVIKAWLDKMYSEELILKALEEAVYNGATSIRYIDTILYEWQKKGFKTVEDVENNLKNRYENKKLEETNILEYNWLEDNENK